MWHSEILWRVLQGWMQVQKLISFILSCHVYLWWAQQLKTWQRKLSSIRIQGKARQGIWKRRLWLVSAAAITAMHHHLGDNIFVSNFLWIQKHWGNSLQMLRILYLNSEESSTFLVNWCFNIPDISMLEHWDILVEGFAVPDLETIPYTVIRQEQDFEIREVEVRGKTYHFLASSIYGWWFQFHSFNLNLHCNIVVSISNFLWLLSFGRNSHMWLQRLWCQGAVDLTLQAQVRPSTLLQLTSSAR